MRKLTKEDFVQRAQEVHGSKYDYTNSVFVGDRIELDILCPQHGVFRATPNAHKLGKICPGCKKENLKQDFIKNAMQMHDNKYTYNNVVYIDSKKRVAITCPIHGDFMQTPNNHLNGHGCPKCKAETNGNRCRGTVDAFIKKATQIHNDKYDYSLVKYTKTAQKVSIICPKHGVFMQTPNAHLSGSGCTKCKNELSAIRAAHTKEDFVKKARQVHGEKYNYDEVEYKGGHTKVKIICPKHGPFMQAPCYHLNNHQGCPICGHSNAIPSIDHLGNSFPSLSQMAGFWGIDTRTYQSRIELGYTVEEALTIPKKFSLGEGRIIAALDELGEDYIHDKSLKAVFKELDMEDEYNDFVSLFYKSLNENGIMWSKSKIDKLRYDFTIIRHESCYAFIEFDGEQHFKPVAIFFKTLENFLLRKTADDVKNEISENYSIPLLRIRYDQINYIKPMICDLLQFTDKYKQQHNTYLSNEEYWKIFYDNCHQLQLAT